MYKNVEVNENTKRVILESLPFFKLNSDLISGLMYQHLFEKYPEYVGVFNMSNQEKGTQKHSLAASLVFYAENFDNIDIVIDRLSRAIHFHSAHGIVESAYEHIAESLLYAIGQVFKQNNESILIREWGNAFWRLANNMIAIEKAYFDLKSNQNNGWEGFKPMILSYRQKSIYSNSCIIRFSNKDGALLPNVLPGQFVNIVIPHLVGRRQYRLIDNNPKYFEILVKKEGMFSRSLFDINEGGEVLVSMPSGGYEISFNKNIFMFSQGIGISPHISLIRTLINNKADVNMFHMYASKDDANNPYSFFVKEFSKIKNLKTYLYFSQNNADKNKRYINKESISKLEFTGDDSFFICGTPDFSYSVKSSLVSLNVNENDIHIESFGPSLFN
ncbi:hypothetical protein [Aliikangiella maris]|uniref:FAD-binding FR-type domain-containing protein n=2 Tax=Aliikangiella maris TaxID=3162458 RepID=A0ABV3MTU8_9GAMM